MEKIIYLIQTLIRIVDTNLEKKIKMINPGWFCQVAKTFITQWTLYFLIKVNLIIKVRNRLKRTLKIKMWKLWLQGMLWIL